MIKNRLEWKRNRQGYWYVLPWVIGFLLFGVIPIASSFYFSMLKWNGFASWDEKPPRFVGLTNYIGLIDPEAVNTESDDETVTRDLTKLKGQLALNHEAFKKALLNNAMFMFFSCLGGILISIFLAALMHEKIKGHKVFRVILFLPTLVVPTAFGLMMLPIFQSGNGQGGQTGLLNWLILHLGGDGAQEVRFLSDPNVAIWTMIITNLWFIGSSMVIFMAGIANIPKSYYEAAEMDGANWWSRFFKITVPLIAPVIFFQIIMALIAGLSVFDLPASLVQLGASKVSMGPDNSLATLVFLLYKLGWSDNYFGLSSAVGWFVFFIGLIFTIIIITYLKRKGKSDAQGVESL